MKTKRVLAGFLTAAMVIGMSQPVMINPVFAEEGTQEQTGGEISDLTQMNKLVDMIASLYGNNVLYTEAPDFQTDIDSLRLEDKSYLLDYYQYHNAQEDDRISDMFENGTENNIATKEALCEIMTDLVGAADEDVMNYVYSDYYISTDGDTCYLRAYGSYGAPPSNFILSDIQSVEDTGDQRILTGEVYDWSDPDYAQGIMNPKGSYRIVVVPSGSHLFDGYTFKEITVTSGSGEEASAPAGEASADEEADLQDMTALMYGVALLEHSCMYGKGSTFSDAENFWAYSAGYFEDYPVTEETGGGTVTVVPAAEVEAYWNAVAATFRAPVDLSVIPESRPFVQKDGDTYRYMVFGGEKYPFSLEKVKDYEDGSIGVVCNLTVSVDEHLYYKLAKNEDPNTALARPIPYTILDFLGSTEGDYTIEL